jgi:hypothetical protein
MNKIIYLASFSFTLTVFLASVDASAQDAGVRDDYARYAKLFETGRELELADFATNHSWRSAYGRNNWKGNADGTERRDPLPEAQVLMGLYMLATVERKLNYEIGSMVQQKALLSKTLADIIKFDQIVEQMERDGRGEIQIRADAELVGDFRGLRSNMERLMRQRLVSSVPTRLSTEETAIKNLFLPEIMGGWEAKYRVIREQISVLDTLADTFAFNWNEERKKKELNRLMDKDIGIQKMAEELARLEIETRPGNLSMEEIQEIKGRKLQEVAQKELERVVAHHTAHKYLIGVYQGMDYHVRDLQRIYRYYLGAANQGNPIAQYHIALFLIYFGDILGMKKEDAGQKSQDWLAKAYHSNLARDRVVELSTQLIADNEKIKEREEATERKMERLLRMEHEKITAVEDVLIQMAKRVRIINETQRRILEEWERERERIAITERERFKAAAMAEAARLESMRPIITIRTR